MSSKRAKAKTTKKRPQRATSNVFAMFDQSQIQEFKEAFNMIDQNRDGFIDKEDLHDMLASMGKNPTDEYLEGMMSEAPGPINFTMFLTMFGEKLNGTDPEDVIRNAFACFDEEASGFIHEDHLRELLTTMGDRFTDEEVDEMYREAPIDKKGNFNYVEFTRILKHGAKDITLLHVVPMLARGTAPLLEEALPSPYRCVHIRPLPSPLPPAGSAPRTQPGSIPTKQLLSPWSRGGPRAGASSPGEHWPVGILAGSDQCSPGDLMQKEALPLPPTLPSFRKEKKRTLCFLFYGCFMALEPVI
uniref:Myosin light chain 9 n=1 Tax=Anser brachyrhynchus TaxID=132585 RepID=A0A8B9I953_9AVES